MRNFLAMRIKTLAAALLPLAAWGLAATVFYGSPIPHSLAAKSAAYRLPASDALVRLLQHYATPFMDHLTFGLTAIAVGLIVYPFLFIAGARAALRAAPRLGAWFAYPWAYFAVFALAHPLIFRWYLTPPLAPLIFGILAGAERLVGGLAREGTMGAGEAQAGTLRAGAWPYANAVRLGLVVALPLALALRDWQLHPNHGPDRPAPGMAWIELEGVYRQAAASLSFRLGPNPENVTLAAGDVGVLGYFTRARILDTVGLVSPEAVAYYPTNPAFYVNAYAVSPDLILDEQPDFVVLLEVYGREGLFKDPRFQASYRLIEKIPTEIYGSDGMLIFARGK